MDALVFVKQVQGRTWYRDLTRASAEEHLKPLEAGAFVVRPSSQANSIALSFKQENGGIGHNTIVAVYDASRIPSTGFRFANSNEMHSSVKSLLKSLPLLRFERLPRNPGDHAETDEDDASGAKSPRATASNDANVIAPPPRSESNIVRGSLAAARVAVVQEQARKLLSLMPARRSEQLVNRLCQFENLDVTGTSRAQLDELNRRTRGKVLLKVFFDVVSPGSPFMTIGVSKIATAREVCQLVSAKRLFPALHRACQLAVVNNTGSVSPLADHDRPAPLSLVWVAKKLPPSDRALVLRLKPEFDIASPATPSPPPVAASAPAVAPSPVAPSAPTPAVASAPAAKLSPVLPPRTASIATRGPVGAPAAGASSPPRSPPRSPVPVLPPKPVGRKPDSPSLDQPRLPWRAAPRLDPEIRKSLSGLPQNTPANSSPQLARRVAAPQQPAKEDHNVVDESAQVYGFIPRALPPVPTPDQEELNDIMDSFTGMAAELELDSILDSHNRANNDVMTAANEQFFFDLPVNDSAVPEASAAYGVELDALLELDDLETGAGTAAAADLDEFQRLLSDVAFVANDLDREMAQHGKRR